MQSLKTWLRCSLGLLLAVAAAPLALAEGSNPYSAIVERNPFGLKQAPPPPETTPPPQNTTQSKVLLTGISSFAGARALFEITDQEPGKTPTTRKPILKEGERDGSIEVVSIDVEKNFVKIRIAGVETNVTFETPKLTGAAPAAPVAGLSPPPLTSMPAAVGAPTVFSPANAAANPPGRGGSFGVFGNSASASPSASAVSPMSAGGSYGNYGGLANPGLASASVGSGNLSLSGVPNRPLRTDNPVAATPANLPSAPVDPVKQYLDILVDHEVKSAGGTRAYPPPPPPPVRNGAEFMHQQNQSSDR